jgi:hypothetical protein
MTSAPSRQPRKAALTGGLRNDGRRRSRASTSRSSRPSPALFGWKEMLESGRFATVNELAKAEKINASYVGHVLRLTLLAPDIVEAILDGRQPSTMQLQPLMRKGFPVEWEEQTRFFEGDRERSR